MAGAATTYPAYYPATYGVAFPDAPLDAEVDLDLGGTWTDITAYALQREGTSPPITITRGRQDETSSVTPSACGMQWNNRSGQFSPRNPGGPYYGLLGRNTPVRVSVPGTGTAYRAEDDSVSYCSAPAQNITGNIDIRVDMQLTGCYSAVLAEQATAGNGNVFDWLFQTDNDGTLAFLWLDSGSAFHSVSSGMPLPYLGRIAVRVTLSASTGTVTFYTAPGMSGSWTVLAAIAGAGASSVLYSPAYMLCCGGQATGGPPFASTSATGRIYEMQVYSGIGGTLVADPQFYAQTAGVSSFTDGQGNTWTLHGSGAIDNRDYRGHFECSSLPQQWDPTGTDVWTPVSASGVLRRLQQGSAPLPSAMKRAILSLPAGQAPAAYWPCEDGQGSTFIASALPGGAPMLFTSAPAFQGQSGSPSADSNFPCSAQLPQVGSTTWFGAVTTPTGYSWADNVTRFLLYETAGTIPSGSELFSINSTGTVAVLTVFYSSPTDLVISGFNAGGTQLFFNGANFGIDGQPVRISAELIGSGGSITYRLVVMQPGQEATEITGTVTGVTGPVTSVAVNPNAVNLGSAEFGQVSVQGTWASLYDQSQPLNAWWGEPAGMRLARLCAENGISSRVYGFPQATAPMGYQPIDTLANLLSYIEVSDRGQVYEPASCLGIGYRTLASLQNQSPAVSLPYSAATLGGDGSQGLLPVDDDQYTLNDVTVSRSNGSSAQAQVTTGAMSIQPPPGGVGDYATQVTVYTAYDTRAGGISGLADIAGWIAWIGTCDEERYPQIPLNLARPELAPYLSDILAAGTGDYVQVTDLPPWLPPGNASQLAYGSTEKLGGLWWLLAWNTVPETPYEVAVAGTGAADSAHADTAGSSLASAASSGAGTLSVATTSGPLWTTSGADFPFDIIISGEQVTVTGITGSSSPQSFTVTRSVNSVVKAQAAGTAVSLYHVPAAALQAG